MKLIEAVQQLATFDGDLTIYARHPWTLASDTRLAIEGSDEEKKTKTEGLRYFLEVFIAREFLIDWTGTQLKPPTDAQSCSRLIEYASDDA